MKISLIIPAYNEEKLIGESLHSIKEAARSFIELGWETELIVCDNNSTVRTAELARAAGARLVFEPVNQISRARNRGAEMAEGDWFVFIDADSTPSPALFAEVAVAMQNGNCVGGGCTVRMDGLPRAAAAATRLWNGLSRIYKWMAGSFIFCEARVFRQLGGFSLALYVAEEIEFSRRLKTLARRTGQRIVILHHHPLHTSARKLRLYTIREYLRFLARAAWGRGQAFRDRSACGPWYDGRR
jgi:glycosyltransferase involved in cell wall biosynthesis